MPIIIQILLALGRLAAGFGGSAAASRFLGPVAGKAIGRIAPGLLGGGKAAGAARTVGKGALSLGGFIGGETAFSGLEQALAGDEGPEPPPDDTVDTVLARIGQGRPFQRDQQEGLQRTFDEAEIRQVLDLLGVDFDEFSQLAAASGGGRGLI